MPLVHRLRRQMLICGKRDLGAIGVVHSGYLGLLLLPGLVWSSEVDDGVWH